MATSLSTATTSLENLIPVINKLQDVFIALHGRQPIDLPQIAVVGSQSVGKSSVIENIVGRDFLPRGSGIVTRRPLLLQLQQVKVENEEEKDENQEWGEFLHIPDRRFYDFNEVRQEIERATDQEAGSGKNIVPEPIRLTIHSPFVVNLTLIDLPGIVKNPLPSQPKDIEAIVLRMIHEYIDRERCLILAVSSATQDIATSEGLKLARQVDPTGNRTLGVITKLDLMDKGTNAVSTLRGQIIPLKLGYIGVVNRSQLQINAGQSIRDALELERQWFANSPEYRHLSCGTDHLVKTLNQILINHIKLALPQLREEIRTAIKEAEDELITYGTLITDEANKGALVMGLISKFATNFNEAIEGSGVAVAKQMQSEQQTDLYGGARIVNIFQREFHEELIEIDCFDGLSDAMILSAIRNASGIKASVFVPELAFENIVRLQIEKLRRPALSCVETIYDELKVIAGHCESVEISRFKRFSYAIQDQVNELLRGCLEPCRDFVNQLIDVELAYINTNHPDFLAMDALFAEEKQQDNGPTRPGQARAPRTNPAPMSAPKTESQPRKNEGGGFFPSFLSGKKSSSSASRATADPFPAGVVGAASALAPGQVRRGGNPRPAGSAPPVNLAHATPREKKEVQVIKKFIKSYFNIVKKNVEDAVPKAIMHLLVNTCVNQLQQVLAVALYGDDRMADLLEEDPEIADKRRQCRVLLDILKKAQGFINELRDVNV